MHSPLEQYLEQVETRLVDLPATQRASEVEEMRQHIEASVEAFMELGCSREEAVTQTLTQFGQAQQVGAELASAHDRVLRSRWDNVPMAAVTCLSANWLLHSGKNLLLPTTYPIAADGSVYVSPASYVSAMLFGMVIAFASGWLTAQVAPRRAILGIALRHIVTFVTAICGFLMLMRQMQIPVWMHNQNIHFFIRAWITSFLVYMPVGMIGARQGRAWKQSQRRRVQSGS